LSAESALAARRVRELMDESKRRLESADPGEETQQVQERIMARLDELIAQMEADREQREKEQQQRQSRCGGRKDGTVCGGAGKPAPGSGAAEARGTGSAGEEPGHGGDGSDTAAAASPEELTEAVEGWARVHPRLREPVIEGATEQVSEKYERLVADYYRCVAERAAE
jgi:hypothetical protein